MCKSISLLHASDLRQLTDWIDSLDTDIGLELSDIINTLHTMNYIFHDKNEQVEA